MAEPKPCPDRIFEFWGFPDQSTARIWVEGDDAEFAAGVVVETENGARTIPHAQVYRSAGGSNAAEVTLGSAEATVLTLFVNFRTDATVTVAFEIVTPGSGLHPDTPTRCTLSGARDQEVLRIFHCQTIEN